MPRPVGAIGEMKLKIMAIIYYNELHGGVSYGYSLWNTLKEKFHCYMEMGDIRNVYRHLKDLDKLELISRGASQMVKGAQPYVITGKGKQLEHRFNKYLDILAVPPQNVEK